MKCANHLKVDAEATCVSCGNAFCSNCLIKVKKKNYCKDCSADILNESNDHHKQTDSKPIIIQQQQQQDLASKVVNYVSKPRVNWLWIILGIVIFAVIAAVMLWFFVQNMQNKEQPAALPAAMISFTVDSCSGYFLSVRNLASISVPSTTYQIYSYASGTQVGSATITLGAGAGSIGTGYVSPAIAAGSYYLRGNGIANIPFTCV